MEEYNNHQSRWQQVRGKKRAHWAILTLDDLPETTWEHRLLIAQLQARYRAAKELDKDKPVQKKSGLRIGVS